MPETQQKREDILASSIQTRSKAHDLIKRMLASLGDPYTRFLSPAEVIKKSFECIFLVLVSRFERFLCSGMCFISLLRDLSVSYHMAYVTVESSPRWQGTTCLVLG